MPRSRPAYVDGVERVELEQVHAVGEGSAGVELLDGVELVVHEDAVRVGVEADVVDPDEPRRDVVLHLEGALAQHEEAVDPRAERDADDVVRRDRTYADHRVKGFRLGLGCY